jgi:hypothetical protein
VEWEVFSAPCRPDGAPEGIPIRAGVPRVSHLDSELFNTHLRSRPISTLDAGTIMRSYRSVTDP